MTIYDFEMDKIDGSKQSLSDYKGKTILIVNTASKCGFTKQFEGLEELYKKYKEEDFVILGFPCNQFLRQDPNSNEEILEFCQLNYGVTFPMFAKLEVKGKKQSPLFKYLVDNTDGKKIEWNFTKFLINKDGEIVERFASKVTPEMLENDVKKLLA